MVESVLRAAIEEQALERKASLGMRRSALGEMPVARGFATIVTGIRRSGKSTLLNQWIESSGKKTTALLFDDLRTSTFEFDDFKVLDKIVADDRSEAVVLDEVQDVRGWELFVNSLLNRGKLVLVTGSNAKMLSRELGTKLTGRHLDMEVFPFSYEEFIRFTKRKRGKESFLRYVNTGGFPAYVKTGMRQVLKDLFNDILYRDIIVRYGLTDTAPIKRLATYLLGHVGCLISPSRLKDAIRVQQSKTVLEYFDHLTECYLIHRLERFADSPKARMIAPKKVYGCDTGLIGAIENAQEANLGHKLENVVYWMLHRRGGDLTYFVASDGSECDFLREADDGTHEAVQVAWSLDDENRDREIGGLVKCLKRFGLKEGVIVTSGQSDFAVQDGCEIKIVPAYDL